MKIAIVIDTWFPFLGGGQVNAFEISKRIAKDKTKIDIITRNLGKDDLKLPKNLKVYKLGKKTTPNNPFSKISFLFKSYMFIKKNNYEVVHIHAFIPGLLSIPLKLTSKIPIIYTVHGTSIGTGLNNYVKELVEKIVLTKIKYNAQITVSKDFFNLSNVNKKIIYIPNGVDIGKFKKVKAKKRKFPTLIFVGRLHPQKNLLNLIKGINLVKKETPNVTLLIVGNGDQKKELKNLVKKLKLTKNVIFKGEVRGNRLIKLYKESHTFILPSIYEGQPLSLLEAWAAKIPVIVTKTGDNKILVKNGINGYLIKNPKNFREISQNIKQAFNNNNLKQLGNNGYKVVVNNFSWDKSAQKTMIVYKNEKN